MDSFSIGLLFGDDFLLDQLHPALGGDPGDFEIRLGLIEILPRLSELLIEVGRRNLRQQLPFLDDIADIDQPAGDISRGARIDGCLIHRRDIAGENEFPRLVIGVDGDEFDRDLGTLLAEFLLLAPLLNMPPNPEDEGDRRGGAPRAKVPRRRCAARADAAVPAGARVVRVRGLRKSCVRLLRFAFFFRFVLKFLIAVALELLPAQDGVNDRDKKKRRKGGHK